MTDQYVIPTPTQEIAENYIKKVHNEICIENRIKIIADKIDRIFKEIFHVEKITINYICHFKTNNTIIYKMNAPGVTLFLPEIPASCLWSDTDLHIALEMMKSDLHDEYIKAKKTYHESPEAKETFWQKICRGFGF